MIFCQIPKVLVNRPLAAQEIFASGLLWRNGWDSRMIAELLGVREASVWNSMTALRGGGNAAIRDDSHTRPADGKTAPTAR